MIYKLFPILLTSTLSFLITYGIGQLLVSFIKIPKKFPFLIEFAKLTIGFYAIFTFYAILKTNGFTILLGLVPMGLLSIYWLKKKKYIVPINAYKDNFFSSLKLRYIAIGIFILLLGILYLYYSLYGIQVNTVRTINGDFFCYASFIENINNTNVESTHLDWYSGLPPIRNLYHWGELWFAAFFIKLFNQLSINGFYFFLFPFCWAVYYIGACSIIEIYSTNISKKKYIVAFFILFTSGIFFYFPSTTIFTRGDWWTNTFMYQPKYLVTSIFILYLIILSKFNKRYLIISIGMASIMANTAAAAAILLFFGMYILLIPLRREEKLKSILVISTPIFAALAFIALYSFIIKYTNNLYPSEKLDFGFTTKPIPIIYYIKTAFNCFVGQLIKSTLSVLPILICFYIFKKNYSIKINKELIVILITIHIASILAYSILFGLMVDSIQLYSYIFVPMNAVCCFLIIQFFIFSNSKPWLFVAIIFIGLSMYQYFYRLPTNSIDQKPYTAILKIYKNNPIAIFKGEKDFSNLQEKGVDGYFPYPYLKFYLNNYNPVCLTTLDIPIDSNSSINLINTEKEFVLTSTFYRFIQKQKNENKFKSIEQSQLDLIKENNIHSVFVYKNAQLPLLIRKTVVDSVYDKNTGITFYTF